jgi:hypothetical protein
MGHRFSPRMGQSFSPKMGHRFSSKVGQSFSPRLGHGGTGGTPSYKAYFLLTSQYEEMKGCLEIERRLWISERC